MTRAYFDEFVQAFGDDPLGKAPRQDQGEAGRFRCFTREQIRARGDNLDIGWLREKGTEGDKDEPSLIAADIAELLRTALDEIDALGELLDENEKPSLLEPVQEAAE